MPVIYVRLTEKLKDRVVRLLRESDTGALRYGVLSNLCRNLLEQWADDEERRRENESDK